MKKKKINSPRRWTHMNEAFKDDLILHMNNSIGADGRLKTNAEAILINSSKNIRLRLRKRLLPHHIRLFPKNLLKPRENIFGNRHKNWTAGCIPSMSIQGIMKVAEYFNNALVVLEINNHGLAVLNELSRLGYMYIFRQRHFDKVTNEWTRKLGWKTTSVTKPLMIDEFAKALREDEVGLSTAATVSQMLTFVHTDEPGRHSMGSESGQRDDRLISAMLAWQGFKDLPTEFMDW